MEHQFDNVGSEGTAVPSHTPGPWQVTTDRAADAMQFPYCVRDAADWSVAYVTGTDGLAATQANARLIAAAPDLLAAAETAYTVLANAPASKMPKGTADAIRALHAALARAKGE